MVQSAESFLTHMVSGDGPVCKGSVGRLRGEGDTDRAVYLIGQSYMPISASTSAASSQAASSNNRGNPNSCLT